VESSETRWWWWWRWFRGRERKYDWSGVKNRREQVWVSKAVTTQTSAWSAARKPIALSTARDAERARDQENPNDWIVAIPRTVNRVDRIFLSIVNGVVSVLRLQ
jgi:hypothetical protein